MAYNPNNPNGQATMANSAPVVIASNQTAIPISDNGGIITVDGSVTVTQSTAASLKTQADILLNGNAVSVSNPLITLEVPVNIIPLTGSVTNSIISLVSGQAGGYKVYGWYVYNNNTVPLYLQFFNSVSPSFGTTTTPYYSIAIPASSGANVFGMGIYHSTAITIAATTGRNNTVGGGSLDYNIFYK